MSGTSADGIDVAVVSIATMRGRPALRLLAHEGFPFLRLRREGAGGNEFTSTSTAELARLNWRLGLAYSEAILSTLKNHRPKLDLIGCHGQRSIISRSAEKYVGERFACTWQSGEARRLRQPGRSCGLQLSPRGYACRGQGAPFVPLLDFALFAGGRRGRVLQNIGGIANLTAIPAGADGRSSVIAFDTGPGNMVIDALTQQLFGITL